jgi:hypothetical protein
MPPEDRGWPIPAAGDQFPAAVMAGGGRSPAMGLGRLGHGTGRAGAPDEDGRGPTRPRTGGVGERSGTGSRRPGRRGRQRAEAAYGRPGRRDRGQVQPRTGARGKRYAREKSSPAGICSGIRINRRKKKLDRNQARVARAGERQNLGSDTILGISNLYSQEAKGQYIYM